MPYADRIYIDIRMEIVIGVNSTDSDKIIAASDTGSNENSIGRSDFKKAEHVWHRDDEGRTRNDGHFKPQ